MRPAADLVHLPVLIYTITLTLSQALRPSGFADLGVFQTRNHWIKAMEVMRDGSSLFRSTQLDLRSALFTTQDEIDQLMEQPGHRLAKVVKFYWPYSAGYLFCGKCLLLYCAHTPAFSDHSLSMDKTLPLSHLTSLKKPLAPETIKEHGSLAGCCDAAILR